MIRALALLLGFQLGGTILAKALALPLPGPVIGMAGLFVAFVLSPRLVEAVAPTARGLLGHLSLLFVPAGVGIVGHLDKLGEDGLGLGLAILGSTVLAILAGVGTFLAVARLTRGRTTGERGTGERGTGGRHD